MPAEPVGPSDMRFCEEWKRCLPFLQPAIERLHGTHLAVDVLTGLFELQLHLWPFQNSAAVTEFVQYPRLRSCNVFLAGGDLSEITGWCDVRGPLEAWARLQGCTMLETTGRPGWAKATPSTVIKTHVVRGLFDG